MEEEEKRGERIKEGKIERLKKNGQCIRNVKLWVLDDYIFLYLYLSFLIQCIIHFIIICLLFLDILYLIISYYFNF